MIELYQEFEKMKKAERSVNREIANFQDELHLSEEDNNFLLIYFYLKKYDTLKALLDSNDGMSPKQYSDKMLEIFRKRLNQVVGLLERYGNSVFHDLDSKDLIPTLKERMIPKEDKIQKIQSDLSQRIKNTYKKEDCDYLCTAILKQGLTELKPSKNRENRYYTGIFDGVYATSDIYGLEAYIARANAGGLIAEKNNWTYPKNPFRRIEGNRVMLLKPVSLYFMQADEFEPQFDFREVNGVPRFIYNGEWVLSNQNIKCEEHIMKSLPISFLTERNVFYTDEKGNKVQITPLIFPDGEEGERDFNE